MGYISKEGLQNVKIYAYKGNDRSVIANYILQPFWRWIVEFLPNWLAPNMVTLIGFFFILASYFVTVSYAPDVSGEAPGWVWVFNALCLFVYQTMDAIDGKQARRTGSSSPLGELFDHGCDAMTTVFVSIVTCTALQIGTSWLYLGSMLTFLSAFYLTQWEQYNTGVLDLGYLNVTEAQLGMMAINFLTFYFGASFWRQELVVSGFTISYGAIPLIISIVTSLLTILANISTVISISATKKVTFRHWVPITAVILLSYVWVAYSPSGVLKRHPHLFMVHVGFLVAFLVGRVVLSRVCLMRVSTFQPHLAPLTFGALNVSVLGCIVPEDLYIQIACAASIILYLHFAVSVINELCSTLNIKCLSITPKIANTGKNH